MVNTLITHLNKYIPGLVKREIWKSGTAPLLFSMMYSKGSDMKGCLVTLLPTPDAATFIQNRFKTEGRIKKWPLVRQPKQADTKGSTTPMCNSIGAFVSFHTSLWYLYTHSGRWFLQLNGML